MRGFTVVVDGTGIPSSSSISTLHGLCMGWHSCRPDGKVSWMIQCLKTQWDRNDRDRVVKLGKRSEQPRRVVWSFALCSGPESSLVYMNVTQCQRSYTRFTPVQVKGELGLEIVVTRYCRENPELQSWGICKTWGNSFTLCDAGEASARELCLVLGATFKEIEEFRGEQQK